RERIKVLKSDRRGPSYARNLAARSTRAELLAFTDSDCIVARDWLSQLLKGFKEYPDAVSCGGAQEIPQDATNFERRVFSFLKKTGFIAEYMRKVTSASILREVNHNPSCNVMYKRDAFLKEGGFLEGLWPGEDVEFDYRLKKQGYTLVFNPQAIVYHYRPQDTKSFCTMMRRYGASCGFLTRRYGFFRKLQFFPLGIAAILIFLFFSIAFDFLPIFFVFLGAFIVISLLYVRFRLSLFALGILGITSWNVGFLRGIFAKKVS
ncbi:MAG: glycosyltransferase, partial [Candidatus Omnitrophota bacterium]